MVISARKSSEERHRPPSSSESVDDDKELNQTLTSDVAPRQKIDFVQSPAERLKFLENDSVDLVIAGMSSHQLPDPTLGR